MTHNVAAEPARTPERLFARMTKGAALPDRVAETILRKILSQPLRPGATLPSQQELSQQFGVSRTVIREAVRSLAAKGVIEVRPGRRLRVAATEASTVTESMILFLHGQDTVDYPRVHEVRSLLEVHVAGLAAERATEFDLKRLRRACEGMARAGDEVEDASRQDVEFHRALARATQNELFIIVLDSIGRALLDIRRAIFREAGGDECRSAHWRVLAAVEKRDAEEARREMRKHLEKVEKAWEELSPRRAAGEPPAPAPLPADVRSAGDP